MSLADGGGSCDPCGALLRNSALRGARWDAAQDAPEGVRLQAATLLFCDLAASAGEAADTLEACVQAVRMFGGWPAYADGSDIVFRFDPPATGGTHQFGAADRIDRAFDAGLNVVLGLGRTNPGLSIALHHGEAVVGGDGSAGGPEGAGPSIGARLLGPMSAGTLLKGAARDEAHAMCRAAPALSMVVSKAAADGLVPARLALLRRLPPDHPAARAGGAYLWQPVVSRSG